MYLAYYTGLGVNHDETDLCLITEKVDALTVPVRIRDLRPNPAAMHRVGPEEAVFMTIDSRDNGLVITPYPPGAIYLTPNLNQAPGFRTKRIKVVREGNQYHVFWDKERVGWEEWVANRERA